MYCDDSLLDPLCRAHVPAVIRNEPNKLLWRAHFRAVYASLSSDQHPIINQRDEECVSKRVLYGMAYYQLSPFVDR